MAMPIEKIEVGFDLTSGTGPFLKLDDPISGVLDDPDWTLGGTIFLDVTDRVKSFSVSRGRSSLFSSFPAGSVSVVFNNHDRAFDPLYTASPFNGNIIPKREIRVKSGGIIQFTGWIDDWNLTYAPNGDSIAEAIAYDATGLLAGRTLPLTTPVVQSSGQRVNAILDTTGVNWPADLRQVDIGEATLSDFEIPQSTNALSYLQNIASTEAGNIFVGKTGKVVFQDRTKAATSDSLVIFGNGGVPFQNLEVVYGSENLYNEIVISREGGGTATAQDQNSIDEYGIRTLTQSNLLFSTDEQSLELALIYAVEFSQPEYRFQSLEIALHKLEEADQEKIQELEIGSVCKVLFTPNGIGDAIVRFVEIVRISQEVNPETHYTTLGFSSLDYAPLVLDDAEFGKLNAYSLSW
tara:strand:- start:1419 stop:2639 length:1221 start_codon:yes stop_codon:yes gene_type:complete